MIYDTELIPINSTNLTVAPDAEKTFSMFVDCIDGYKLTGVSSDPLVSIFGKAEPGDGYTDIIATPIDTTPFAPTRKQFYFKVEVDAGATIGNALFSIRVGR